MAIYSLSISNVSRAKGSSALATLSYITATRVADRRLGKAYEYGRGERVLHTNTLLPDGAPSRWRSASVLFNDLELAEKASNARSAKKIILALPREWGLRAQARYLEEFIQKQFIERGYAATYAIHMDKAGVNPHAHILIPNRQIDPNTGEWATKRKSAYALDENGERIPVIDPATGEQKIGKQGRRMWKREYIRANPLDEKATLEQIRAGWAEIANKHLEPEAHISHLSLKAQGIDREAQIHEGYAAQAIDKRGGVSERVELNRHIKAVNAQLVQIDKEMNQLEGIIERLRAALERTVGRAERAIEGIKSIIDECTNALAERFKRGSVPSLAAITDRQSILDDENRALEKTEGDLKEEIEALRADIRYYEGEILDYESDIRDLLEPREKPEKQEDEETIEEPMEAPESPQEAPQQSLGDMLSDLRGASRQLNQERDYSLGDFTKDR